MKRTLAKFLGLLVLLGTGSAQAMFIDRGNGMVYDTVVGISWTQDASLLGVATWPTQTTNASNLIFAGYDDFRLPTIDELYSLYTDLPGIFGSNKGGGNLGPFFNIAFNYWSSTPYTPIPGRILFMDFIDGNVRLGETPGGRGPAWAVRSGDSVPEPGSLFLAVWGIAGLGMARRWRRS